MSQSQIRLTNPPSSGSVVMAGQSISSSLTFPKVLGLADSAARPKLKMSISQANAAVKSTTSVTNQKTLAQIPIQLGGQIKNQHITLAALNQLTAGKLSGSQVSTAGGKTVKIISPAKAGQTIRPQLNIQQKLGLNNPITSPAVSSAVALQQSLKLPVCGTTATTTATTATQYALVRAQVPGSGGAPPQTLTFIRAISPNTSSTAGGTTVTVTPQQMAALLKGQQGQTQIQKVLSGTTGITQVRPSLTANAGTNAKAGSVQVAPSKIVSVQFPTKMAGNNPLKSVSMGSLLGTKILTTQSTNISPMATLVSGAGTKSSSTSLVNQFPAVRPQLPSGLAALSVLAASTKTQATSVTTQESFNTAVNLTSITNLNNPTNNHAPVTLMVNPDTAAITTNITNPSINSNPSGTPYKLEVDKIDANNSDIKAAVSENNGINNLPMNQTENKPVTDNPIQENNISNSNIEMKDETKMEVDPIKKEQPAVLQNSLLTGMKDKVSTKVIDEVKQEDPASVESAAATTLAHLASIAGSTTNISNTLMNADSTVLSADISQTPLSTLAALASSSPIATGPIENLNEISPNKSLNGGLIDANKKVSFQGFIFCILIYECILRD